MRRDATRCRPGRHRSRHRWPDGEIMTLRLSTPRAAIGLVAGPVQPSGRRGPGWPNERRPSDPAPPGPEAQQVVSDVRRRRFVETPRRYFSRRRPRPAHWSNDGTSRSLSASLFIIIFIFLPFFLSAISSFSFSIVISRIIIIIICVRHPHPHGAYQPVQDDPEAQIHLPVHLKKSPSPAPRHSYRQPPHALHKNRSQHRVHLTDSPTVPFGLARVPVARHPFGPVGARKPNLLKQVGRSNSTDPALRRGHNQVHPRRATTVQDPRSQLTYSIHPSQQVWCVDDESTPPIPRSCPIATMEHCLPVQNSEVYLLSASYPSTMSLPSPPSTASPGERALSPPLDDLMSTTPPDTDVDTDSDSSSSGGDSCITDSSFRQRLAEAVHVLSTEATALSALTLLYESEPTARASFNRAVEAIIRSRRAKGRLIVCGVGKSGYIGTKLVATMNSLQIVSHYLHPTEALHGDLGGITDDDTILLITFSGSTPELLQLLPHLDPKLPLIIITGRRDECEVSRRRPDAILLPAPIHKSETECFGFNAPTVSTTMALALGDALSVTVAKELHINVQAVFSRFHPGGAIGASAQAGPRCISDLTIPIQLIPELSRHTPLTGAHVLMSAYKSPKGWVRLGDDALVPPRRIQKMSVDDMDEPASCIAGLVMPRREWILVPAEMSIPQVRDWLLGGGIGSATKNMDDAVLVTMVRGEAVGAVEVATVMA